MLTSEANIPPEDTSVLDGHATRSAETKARMIAAAIEVFGSVGYEGASTRMLVDRAGVNLSSLPYHFGTKRGLYLAAAQELASYARDRLGPICADLEGATLDDAAQRVERALVAFFKLVIDNAEPQSWTAFLVRCVQAGDEAFHIIHDTAIAPFQTALMKALSVSSGRLPTEMMRVRVSMAITAIIGFRTLGQLAMRGSDWDEMTPPRRAQLEQVIRELVRSNFMLGPSVEATEPS